MKAFWLLFLLFLFISPMTSEAKTEKSLRIGVEEGENRPYGYTENKRWLGYHVELIENVAQNLNWKIEWVPIAWPRNYNLLFTGEIDAICFLMKTPSRPESNVLFLDDNIINYFKIFLYSRKNPPVKTKINKNNFSLLARYPIGVIDGGIADRWITTLHPEILLNRNANSSIQLFEMLDKKRFDYVLALNYSFDVAATSNPSLKNLIQVQSDALMIAPAYLAFRYPPLIATSKTAEEFGKALATYKKTRAYEDLRAKYSLK
jgi:polar amino acid transport system substrate-binding protein